MPFHPVQAPAQLRESNTLRLPCEAAALLQFDDTESLQDALEWCARHSLRPLPLGEGSNVVLPQQLPRAVLCSVARDVEVIEVSDAAVILRVGAAKNWHQLVRECVQEKRYGIENLALIPGSVGAAPVQNIGAYGVELSRVLAGVHGVDLVTGKQRYLDNQDCDFAYRDSIFKRELSDRFAITGVELRLSREPCVDLSYAALARHMQETGMAATPESVFDAVVTLRRQRLPDPAAEPNAGSFFKNPVVPAAQAAALLADYPGLPVFPVDERWVKLSAAWLIDQCGFKGATRDRVGVSSLHALVLVNHGGVQDDLLSLATDICAVVSQRFGCELEIEPVVYRGE